VVLSDGHPDQPGPDPNAAALAEADLIEAAGMDLYTIGVGSDVDQAFLALLTRGAGTHNALSGLQAFINDWITACLATPVHSGTWSRLKVMYR
jgi:hypothetical protein